MISDCALVPKLGGCLDTNSALQPPIDTVLHLLTSFYESVVQDISPWQPKAPKLKRERAIVVFVEETDAIPPSPSPTADSDAEDSVSET